MKNLLLIGMIVCGAILPVKLFSKEIDKGKLEKARDYVNGKITYLFLEAYIEKDKSKKGEFESIKSDLQIKDVESAKGATELKKILDGKFTRTIGQLVDPINNMDISTLTDLADDKAAGKMVDDAFAILSEKYKKEYDFLQSEREYLVMAIVNFLGLPGGSENQEDRGGTGRQKDTVFVTTLQKAGFFSSDHLSVWTVLLFLMIAGAFVYLMREIKYLHAKLRKLAIDNDTAEFEKMAGNSKEPWYNKQPLAGISMKDIEKAVMSSVVIQSLVDDVNFIKNSLEKKSNTNIETNLPAPKTTVTGDNKDEIFYMAGPVNHYFPLSAKSTTKENTVYRFILKGNKTEAVYELHTSGAPVHEILSMVESYIRPACDEENLPGDAVRSIVTKTKGIAVLEGDRWIIKTKAVIRYE